MATPSPVRLLIADLSENRAHEIDSVLHRWYDGITARITFPLPPDPADDDRAAAVLTRLHADRSA